jgi:16S rRNA (adenine1518-N6/adenine1519-N6)-dimethyltransferase
LDRVVAGDERVEVLEANAARLDWPELVGRLGRPPVVVGNLPYHMASQILFHLLSAGQLLSHWVLMVQREMAQRLTASPGGRDYGVLSVQVQLVADVETALEVAPDSFLPSPRVYSRVVVGRTLSRPRVEADDYDLLRELVRGLFGQRRKQIRNSLKAGWANRLGLAGVDAVLAEAGVGPQLRPEQLDLETFARLSNALGARLQVDAGRRHQ